MMDYKCEKPLSWKDFFFCPLFEKIHFIAFLNMQKLTLLMFCFLCVQDSKRAG